MESLPSDSILKSIIYANDITYLQLPLGLFPSFIFLLRVVNNDAIEELYSPHSMFLAQMNGLAEPMNLALNEASLRGRAFFHKV